MFTPRSKFDKQKQKQKSPSSSRPSKKVSYVELLKGNNITDDKNLGELAEKVMQLRVIEETKQGKATLSMVQNGEKCLVSWPLMAKNFAIVQFVFKKDKDEYKTITTEPSGSNPGQRSSDDSTTHSERYALGEAINEAISQGWKPKGIINPQLLGVPPSEKEFLQYQEALNEVSIVLFSEREPCNREHGTFPKEVATCGELFNNILTSDNHHLYHVVNWNETQKKDFEKEVKAARQVYYQSNKYQFQEEYISQHPEEVEELKKKNDKTQKKGALELQEPSRQKISQKKKVLKKKTHEFESEKEKLEDDQLSSTQKTKKRKNESVQARVTEEPEKKQKTESSVPTVDQDLQERLKRVQKQKPYLQKKEEQTIPPVVVQYEKKPMLLQFRKKIKRHTPESEKTVQETKKKKKIIKDPFKK